MFYMYEAIIITKILMHFSSQKRYKREYVLLLPFPPVKMPFMYHVNNNMYFVESITEHIKASLPIHKQCAGTIR